jgi:hypothetical protein
MLYFLFLIQILLIIILVITSIQFYRIVFRGFAPFISSGFNVILTVLKELDLKGDEVVYELGSGSAGFLRSIEQKFKNQKLIGIEYSWWPYILSNIQIAFSGSKIKILRKNILKVDLKEADIIYCFLNKTTMAKLSKKFAKECKPETLIISYCFTLPNYEPEKTVKEKNNNIYFYRI